MATAPQVNTPVPQQNPSVMTPVGNPAAAHLGPPQGIPSGPSAAELMLQIENMGRMIAELQAGGASLMARSAPQEVVEKTYYHQTPGSNIIVTRRGPQGEHIPEVVSFDHRGELVTSDEVVQAFIEGIVDRPGVPIYRKHAPEVAPDAAAAASEVAQIAARSIDKLGAEASKK